MTTPEKNNDTTKDDNGAGAADGWRLALHAADAGRQGEDCRAAVRRDRVAVFAEPEAQELLRL